MDSLQSILGSKNFGETDEIEALQNYIKQNYKSTSSVRLQRDTLILSVPNSALAATLHLKRQQIIDACRLTKRLVIRTGR